MLFGYDRNMLRLEDLNISTTWVAMNHSTVATGDKSELTLETENTKTKP